ncbi:hypothetical protein EDX97_09425 [Absicoccus porci]|uniref:Type II toxin-antitoxin system PemK/MazF family toxin n=2 Tax=Absicoccus porci TaxID=2486576 RepID=A0A3N0HYI9_9FIRM|nr:type II toxin-antitoxin system PemK/MazF family toxin [Absicoccus porci]RNM29833.1 hypothetical protein EDX97_09425 [Absicoccus porci]
MTEKELKEKCKSLQKSSDTLQAIIKNCRNKKFYHLDSWEAFQAKTFYIENKNSNARNKYLSYKRGTVVFVNFGTSIGNELSGHHFGIVLNKKDSPYNGNLTVLPLTSKYKKYHISLETEIILNIFDSLLEQERKIQEVYDLLNKELFKQQGNIVPDVGEVRSIEDHRIVWFLKKFAPDKKANEDGMAEYTSTELNELLHIVNSKIRKVNSYYKEKNKGSFGMINSITTVSKYRINKPLNELDPIGHIRVSDEIMNRIDREIIKSYTSIDLTQENG